MDTSRATYAARMMGVTDWITPALMDSARADPDTPFAPLYALWAMDNYALEGRQQEALAIAEEWERRWSAYRLKGLPLLGPVLEVAAQMYRRLGEPELELRAWMRLIKADAALRGQDAVRAWYGLGQLAQSQDRWTEAIQYFERGGSTLGDPQLAEVCRRNALRLKRTRTWVREDPLLLATEILRALRRRQRDVLSALASESHFSLGQLGAHSHFTEPEAILPSLFSDLTCSSVYGDPYNLRGHGNKRYFVTEGWKGAAFQGRIWFKITRAPGGWEWSGVGTEERLHGTNALFRRVLGEPVLLPNDPLEIEIKAPWAAPLSMQAGGMSWWFTLATGGLVAGDYISGPIRIAIGDRDCGFGPGGYYYNISNALGQSHRFATGNTNDDWTDDQYAIDFTRWERANASPRNLSKGTPIVACAQGVVLSRVDYAPTGDAEAANRVDHRIISTWAEDTPYTARYLHLDGPSMITVSAGMWVNQGHVLGLMNDTGESFHDHLHFEIHDSRLREGTGGTSSGRRASGYGRSVRPTPMDGQSLNDGDDGRCITSTNQVTNPLSYCQLLASISGDARASLLCGVFLRDRSVLGTGIRRDFDPQSDDTSVYIDASSYCNWVANQVPPISRAEVLRTCLLLAERRGESMHAIPSAVALLALAPGEPDPRFRPKAHCLWHADREPDPGTRSELRRLCNAMPDDPT